MAQKSLQRLAASSAKCTKVTIQLKCCKGFKITIIKELGWMQAWVVLITFVSKIYFWFFFKESGIYTLCIIHVPLGLRLILQKQTSVVPPPVPRLISGRNGEKFCSLNKRNNQTALLQENIHEIYRCTLTLKHRDYFFYHFGEFANILIHSLI